MKTEEKSKSLLSIPSAAIELGVAEKTVREWIRAGDLEAVKMSSRCVRIHPEEIERKITSHTLKGNHRF